MPTLCAFWKIFPSCWIAGAIISSVSCSSLMFCAPTVPMHVRSAPTRFCVPSSVRAGP